jgi:hypothetical protein
MLFQKPFYILLFFFLVPSWALAQEIQQDDPYKKPQIWKKIKANPNDSLLWALYLGKKWAVMTNADKEEIANWKQELYIQSIAEKEAVYGMREKEDIDLFAEKPTKATAGTGTNTSARPVKSVVEMKQILAMESMIMQERSDIAKLKQNIYENFVIIEDMLREEFAAFNVNYRYYDDVHADHKYSEIKWIEEQEARLKKLKQEKVASLKKQAGIK